MVLINIKGKSEADQFLCEAKTTDSLDPVSTAVVEQWNLRLRLKWYLTCARELQKGVAQIQEIIEKCERDLKESQTTVFPLDHWKEQVRLLRAAVTIGYPLEASGPLADLAKAMESLEIDEETRLRKQHILHVMDNEGQIADQKELYDPATANLWFASKLLHRDKILSDFVGKNEKTKITCKITSATSGAPAREPAIDQQTQKEMMAYWFKKQEEDKRLAEDDEIAFGSSEWANPKAMKAQFQGLRDLRLR
eukprot:NODE_2889_length_1095_cov_34.442639_g2650_i0.p1 GENE.NODE_2889_length_1095_cov_34.442639_g2650_i0~~NODE_2889_length_1095_cov_34.442639_g2650_i0.p1  ORF type:complete len:251 (+),score=57.75 NODE_2889_length_1095_cov_34.442639_g2650_i0:121-873(+)